MEIAVVICEAAVKIAAIAAVAWFAVRVVKSTIGE